MRVVCPVATVTLASGERGLRPECGAALLRYAPHFEIRELGVDPHGYHQLLEELWRTGESFLIVEHDVEIHENVVPELEQCPEPWCLFRYDHWLESTAIERMWHVDPGTNILGCTRFTAEVTAAVDLSDLTSRERDWRVLAHCTAERVRAAGFEPHLHTPGMTHHHDYRKDSVQQGISHAAWLSGISTDDAQLVFEAYRSGGFDGVVAERRRQRAARATRARPRAIPPDQFVGPGCSPRTGNAGAAVLSRANAGREIHQPPVRRAPDSDTTERTFG